MKLVRIINPDEEITKKIVEIEQEAFEGNGNVDLWIIKALIRYGLVFVLEKDNKIISIIEYMQKFQDVNEEKEKKVFLYGLSTLKKYRHQGYAKFLLEESEKYLKKLNFEEIELTVDPENKIAIDFYTKYGYEKIKFLKDEYGENINRDVMRKIIKNIK